MKKNLAVLSILLISCTYADNGIKFKTGFESDGIPAQMEMVAKLSGHLPIKDKRKISDRYSLANRQLAREYLLKRLSTFCDSVYSQPYSNTGENIVGLIRSTVPSDEFIIIGAHYDSVKDCPGANDNATGVALVHSVGEYLSGLEERKRNVLVVFFDEEEKGLVGSKAFAEKLLKEAINVHSVHTVDQMGWDNELLENGKVGDRAIELERPSEEMKALYKQVVHGFPIHISNIDATDHRSFRKLGFDAVGLTEEYVNKDTTPHYHKASDSFITINFEYLKSTTEYMKTVMLQLMK